MALEAPRKVALDSNVLIYLLEGVKPYAERAEEFLEAFMARRKLGVISTISVAEILTGFYASGDERRAQRAKTLVKDLTRDGLQIADVTWEIADLAARLRARRGGRLPDALIVATALHHEVEALYSQDKDLERFGEDIRIVKLL